MLHLPHPRFVGPSQPSYLRDDALQLLQRGQKVSEFGATAVAETTCRPTWTPRELLVHSFSPSRHAPRFPSLRSSC
eukprot:scaffold6672_cov286-Pinguiococcus_pyrenoidosus.AAC.3